MVCNLNGNGKTDRGLAKLTIKTAIRQRKGIAVDSRGQKLAPLSAGGASDLKHVSEVGVDVQVQPGHHRLSGEILDSKGFIETSVPKQSASMNSDLTGGDQLSSAVVKSRIGQICGEDDIVAADCPTEQLWDCSGDTEGQPGEYASVVLEEAIGTSAWAHLVQLAVEIAGGIEDREQIVMLENTQGFAAEQRRLGEFDGLSCLLAH